MKINPFDSLRPAAPAKPASVRDAGSPDFASILAEKSEKKPTASAVGGLENEALIGRLLAGRSIDEAGAAGAETRRQLEKTLDQMELYALALGDDGRSLKDIAPLADGLDEAAGRLSQLSLKLPESDPLKGLSDEASVLAAVEAIKFRRGDYI